MAVLKIDGLYEADSGVPANQFYRVRVDKCEPGTSQAGNPKLDVMMTIIDAEHMGRKLFDALPLMANAFRTAQFLKALDALDADGTIHNEDTIGRELLVFVKHDDNSDRNVPGRYKKAD